MCWCVSSTFFFCGCERRVGDVRISFLGFWVSFLELSETEISCCWAGRCTINCCCAEVQGSSILSLGAEVGGARHGGPRCTLTRSHSITVASSEMAEVT